MSAVRRSNCAADRPAPRARRWVRVALGVLALAVIWPFTGTDIVGGLICAALVWYAGATVFSVLLDSLSNRGTPVLASLIIAAICGAFITGLLPMSLAGWWGFAATVGLIWLDVLRRTWPGEALRGPCLRREIFEPPRRGGP